MNPGELTHYLEVYATVQVAAAAGGTKPEDQCIGFLWARIETLGGSERDQGGAHQARSSFLIHAQFFPGLTSKHRLVQKGRRDGPPIRTFNIEKAINVDERDREMEIYATELEGR